VFEQTTLEVPLVSFRTEGQEIEIVRVFRDLPGEIGLRSWQGAVEVRDGFALTLEKAAFDLVNQDVAAPAVLKGGVNVSLALDGILHVVENAEVMAPWNLCNKLLHNCLVRPGLGERPHVLQIAGREASHLGKSALQIG